MPFAPPFFDAAFAASFVDTLSLSLLSAAPASGATALTEDIQIAAATLGLDALPTLSAIQWSASTDDAGLWRVTNSATIDFGAAAETITAIGVAISGANSALLGWAPLVDASGCQVTRTFEAGDSIILPIGALSIGVTT